jgi:hypothetical protein
VRWLTREKEYIFLKTAILSEILNREECQIKNPLSKSGMEFVVRYSSIGFRSHSERVFSSLHFSLPFWLVPAFHFLAHNCQLFLMPVLQEFRWNFPPDRAILHSSFFILPFLDFWHSPNRFHEERKGEHRYPS